MLNPRKDLLAESRWVTIYRHLCLAARPMPSLSCLPQSLCGRLGAGEGGSEGGGTLPPQSSATSSPATFVLPSKRRRSEFKGSQPPRCGLSRLCVFL